METSGRTSKRPSFSSHLRLLDVFVKVDPDEHPEDAQNVHLNVESKDQFDQDKIDGKRRVDAGIKVRRENTLNGALRCHDVENLPEYPAKESADQHEDEQNPGRFSHAPVFFL